MYTLISASKRGTYDDDRVRKFHLYPYYASYE